jgi:hypothetical protein
MANNINEKIYLAVWWWLWVLSAIGVINLVYWISRLVLPAVRSDFIKKAIFNGNTLNEQDMDEALENKDEECERKKKNAREYCIEMNKVCEEKNLEIYYDPDVYLASLEKNNEKDKAEYMKKFETYTCGDPDSMREFMEFIGADSVLLFRLMRLNSSFAVTSALISQLYYDFVDGNKVAER